MKKLFLFLSFIFGVSVQANTNKINQIKTFSEVLPFINKPETVLLISIDNVLLKSPLQMGQRSWFYYRKKSYLKSGLNEAVAAQKALAEWTGVISLFGQIAVADDIAKTIEDIQKKKIKIIGLSSRGLGLASLTIQHLKDAGIDLGLTSGLNPDQPLILGDKLLLYRHGVLFTSGVGKVNALEKLFNLVQISRPKKIVMISQDERTLGLMGEGLAYQGYSKTIEFMPLRYTAMDQEIKNFDAQIADIQFASLMKVLTNEEAKAQLEKINSPDTSQIPHK